MPHLSSSLTVDFPILWLLLSFICLYLFQKYSWRRFSILSAIFTILFVIGLLPQGIQQITILFSFIIFLWTTRLLFCDIILGLFAPLYLRKFRRLHFGNHVGKIQGFHLRHFCIYTEKKEKVFIPYHHYLTQDFRILDSITHTYTFPIHLENHALRLQRVKKYLFDSPFSDSDNWKLIVEDKIYIHVQLFRERDIAPMQEVLHQIFYQNSE